VFTDGHTHTDKSENSMSASFTPFTWRIYQDFQVVLCVAHTPVTAKCFLVRYSTA